MDRAARLPLARTIMKLFAISDLHVGFAQNRAAIRDMRSRHDDWLILAGDVCESPEHLAWTLDELASRFQRLIWVPGNHELWTMPGEATRGQDRYDALVALCRDRGVLTPEDDYVVWEGHGGPHLLAPMFLLYDYTFRPDHVAPEQAVAWAAAAGIRCADEELLHATPFASRAEWCRARCALTEHRLSQALDGSPLPTILINHFPLKQALAQLPAIPRFSPWCGTRLTEDWHRRFNARVVVSGHLHLRRTSHLDGVRFEEVSLGYPERQWNVARGADAYLREIL